MVTMVGLVVENLKIVDDDELEILMDGNDGSEWLKSQNSIRENRTRRKIRAK